MPSKKIVPMSISLQSDSDFEIGNSIEYIDIYCIHAVINENCYFRPIPPGIEEICVLLLKNNLNALETVTNYVKENCS